MPAASPAPVRVTAVSRPYPDGQRVIAAAIEYDAPVDATSVHPEAFEVENRTVVRAYVADGGFPYTPVPTGRTVVVGLDPADRFAATLKDRDGLPKDYARPRGGGSRGPQGTGPQTRPNGPAGDPGPWGNGPRGPQGGPSAGGPQGGRAPVVGPNGRPWHGPHGISAWRDPQLDLLVRQIAPLRAADGATVSPWSSPLAATREDNGVNDAFARERFEDIAYNLFVPREYDPATRYPLVLFIHDAGAIGADPRITLEQGIGATCWALPEEQAKHPCFVVAPQHAKEFPITNDDYEATDDLETIKRLLDDLQRRFSIDPDRIYVTGQSMGFMSTCELFSRYPDYFAAAIPVAGHWDVDKVADLWAKNVWMFLSGEDRGGLRMGALPEAAAARGGRIGWHEWDADQPVGRLCELLEQAKHDGDTFRITLFPGDSIWREHQPGRTMGGGHFGTWHLTYQIEALRDWLFEQRRR